MPTSYEHFCLLPFEQQLPLVWTEGTLLAKRWEEEDAVGLYYLLGSFFCEVYYEPANYDILRIRCFTSSECLEDYTHNISLGALPN